MFIIKVALPLSAVRTMIFLKSFKASLSSLLILLEGILFCFKTLTHLGHNCAASSLSGPINLQAVSMDILKCVTVILLGEMAKFNLC